MLLGGGGLGLVGVVAFVILRLLGAPVTLGDLPDAPVAQPDGPTRNAQLGGSCVGVRSDTDPAKFVSCVVSNVQHFWEHTLGERGRQYRAAHLVLFSEATRSACGVASAATGPFYCPADGKVYLDLGFFHELHTRFGAHGGDFAEAYVVAHEYGHHIQDLLGLERRVRTQMNAERDQANALSVRLELQADCYAGVWGHSAYEQRTVARSEIAQALDAAAAVGDDRIQAKITGRIDRESFTHGSAAERQHWFEVGMESGNLDACDTFAR
jgi:predicted metalloprotease